MKKLMMSLLMLGFLGGAASIQAGVSASESIVDSHSGGTNAQGCHNDTKRGTYHCH